MSSADWPLSASTTWWPASRSATAQKSRISGSSSTTRMCAMEYRRLSLTDVVSRLGLEPRAPDQSRGPVMSRAILQRRVDSHIWHYALQMPAVTPKRARDTVDTREHVGTSCRCGPAVPQFRSMVERAHCNHRRPFWKRDHRGRGSPLTLTIAPGRL